MATNDPIAELITSFSELNPAIVEELQEDPSPLEFMRFVATNTPFVIRGGAADWTATQRWSADYLLRCLREQSFNIAVTPFGFVQGIRAHQLRIVAEQSQERGCTDYGRRGQARLRQTA
jgi:hypothetical protein